MYHNFFIHSSVSGHLDCFHVLAMVYSAAASVGMHVSFSVLISSGCMLSGGIAGSYGGFILSLGFFFFLISILFCIVAVSIYILTNSAKGFPFLHTLSSIYHL